MRLVSVFVAAAADVTAFSVVIVVAGSVAAVDDPVRVGDGRLHCPGDPERNPHQRQHEQELPSVRQGRESLHRDLLP
jgi:hypothetical protein